MLDFIKGLWPRNPFTWLGLILGAMSVLALIQYGFNYGFGPTFTLLLAYYENLIHALIGWWAEPIIRAWLVDLSAYFGWDLNLYPHWKHVFVIMGVYFFRDAANEFRKPRNGTILVIASLLLITGLAISLATSVAVGTFALAQGDMWANFLIAALPVAGIGLYDMTRRVWASIAFPSGWETLGLHVFYGDAQRTFVGIALILFGLQVPIVQHLTSPGLAMLGALVLLRAFLILWQGTRPVQPEDMSDAYFRTGRARLGAGMLGVFFWTGLFIALNAGLRFYGL